MALRANGLMLRVAAAVLATAAVAGGPVWLDVLRRLVTGWDECPRLDFLNESGREARPAGLAPVRAERNARRGVTEDRRAQLPRAAGKRARQDSNLRPPA